MLFIRRDWWAPPLAQANQSWWNAATNGRALPESLFAVHPVRRMLRGNCFRIGGDLLTGGRLYPPPLIGLRLRAYRTASSGTLNWLMAPLPMKPRSAMPMRLV